MNEEDILKELNNAKDSLNNVLESFGKKAKELKKELTVEELEKYNRWLKRQKQ